jgi:hypothetical protein
LRGERAGSGDVVAGTTRVAFEDATDGCECTDEVDGGGRVPAVASLSCVLDGELAGEGDAEGASPASASDLHGAHQNQE